MEQANIEPDEISRHEDAALGEWHATAICGNDITSSCLYVSALAILWAGPWAPLSLIMVAAVLWLFRRIYAEVVGAMPLNGGAYNALLNTTSKKLASVAACLTILSYLATAVISASEAVHYGVHAGIAFGAPESLRIHIPYFTVALLGAFAFLVYRGIGESARVALAIFIFHILSLSVLLLSGAAYVFFNGSTQLVNNFKLEPIFESSNPLLFGFCVAMLGISGFESSANFVEEQKRGVFPKTLRNMWIAVSFFNPTICLLTLAVLPMAAVAQNQEALLSHLAQVIGGAGLGKPFSIMISIDAALVLSGAVLTSYVGVTGLVHRMALDRCLPQFLLRLSRFRTLHYVIATFFLLCSVLLYVAKDVHHLAGVYTISFLCVMLLFTVGNALLKIYRGSLPRDIRASWLTVCLAALAVTVGIWGNISLNTEYLKIFLYYFLPSLFIVGVMLGRTMLLKIGIYLVREGVRSVLGVGQSITRSLEGLLDSINAQTVVFFTRGDNLANLNTAMLYVARNEHTNRVKVVTVVKSDDEVPDRLPTDLKFLDEAYPQMNIEFIVEKGEFTPELLDELSARWNIPLNFMFIGSPGNHFPHRIADLGGVRLII